MGFESFSDRPCGWMDATDTDPERALVIASRARLARNRSDRPFHRRLDRDAQTALARDMLTVASSVCAWPGAQAVDLADCSGTERTLLVERQLITNELAQDGRPAGTLIARDERASLMFNEEDHVRLQTLRPGLAIDECLSAAIGIDQNLERHLPWAVDHRFGYLTACPTNVGTGLRLSVMMHLPALAHGGDMQQVLRGLGKLGLVARGPHGEGSQPEGDCFQISNQHTLGLSEDDILQRLHEAVERITGYELMAREALLGQQRWMVEDKVFRAEAVLRAARRLASGEWLQHWSWLRLGMIHGLIDAAPLARLDAATVLLRPAHLQLRDPAAAESSNRDRLRASLVRDWLN